MSLSEILIIGVGSVLSVPICWAIAVLCQAFVAKQIRRLRPVFSRDEALALSGLFITTGLIYAIALCAYLTFN